ncbi:MAG: ABC transporter ATP-binding protein [Deltaproteobacteria bacterium]|nr:ABC transporter ATP-binding protein [Deltaproteobacteria bacterium]
MAAITTDDLSVRRGGTVVLDAVTLSLGRGVFALVGPNGAGKSTLLRALAGVQPPARGTISIDGHDLWRDRVQARRRLGYLPESPELFPYLTARELLHTANAVRGVPPQTGEDRFAQWVRPEALDLRIGALSAGQRRKLALTAAIAHEPPVLLLDEPANTLDAAAQADLVELLATWRQHDRTIVVAIHRPETLAVEFDGRLVVADRGVQLER